MMKRLYLLSASYYWIRILYSVDLMVIQVSSSQSVCEWNKVSNKIIKLVPTDTGVIYRFEI